VCKPSHTQSLITGHESKGVKSHRCRVHGVGPLQATRQAVKVEKLGWGPDPQTQADDSPSASGTLLSVKFLVRVFASSPCCRYLGRGRQDGESLVALTFEAAHCGFSRFQPRNGVSELR